MGNSNSLGFPISSLAAAAAEADSPQSKGCPVAHHGGAKPGETPAIPHSSSSPHPSSSSSAASAAAAGRPAVCPVAHTRSEPAKDKADQSAASGAAESSHSYVFHPPTPLTSLDKDLHPIGELTPDGAIPAAGRGNSEDGKSWVNPSPNQLYRALHRKNKGIDPNDIYSVSTVHEFITSETWNGILKYENSYHFDECPQGPKLERFYGMDGIYSMKAKFYHTLMGSQYPFDRHDWIVNRCGKEIKYIIDYYSNEELNKDTNEVDISYYIDTRPAPNFSGLYDRLRMSYQEYKNGEKWW